MRVEKKLSGRGDLSEKESLLKLASETPEEEKILQIPMDMKYEDGLKEFLKQNPGKDEKDYQIEVIGIDLVKGPELSRENLLKMLESEFPRVYRLYKNNLNNIPTREIKKILDNLDRDSVPFSNGGSANGKSSMKRSDFLKLPFRDRVEKMFGVSLRGDEKLSEIQIKLDGLQPMLVLED